MDIKNEIQDVIQTLQSLVADVDSIADELVMASKGINGEKCVNYLRKLALGYRMAIRELEMLDVGSMAADFAVPLSKG